MRIIKRPKKQKNEFRTIYCPNSSEKNKLRDLLPELETSFLAQEKKILGNTKNIIVHGFVPQRSIVTNAQCHIGFDYTINFDLEDFFDTVKLQMVKDLVTQDVLNKCFIDLAPRQGLPTSPLVANIAALKLDRAILRFFNKRNLDIVYTRYADDLSFSYTQEENEKFSRENDQKSLHEFLISNIPNIISKNGFRSNKRKIHFQSSKFGRRNITGVKVDDKVYISRDLKRRIRAAKHQKNETSLAGMLEFSKLKTPNQSKKKQKNFSQVETLKILFSRKKIPEVKHLLFESKFLDIPEKNEKIHTFKDKKFILTNDVVYKYGMSALGDGWKSCYSTSSSNRNAPVIMCFIKGVYICAELSEKTKRFGKFHRHLLKSRTIVYQLDNGEWCFNSSFYGNNTKDLQDFLISQKIKPSKNYKGSGVIGYGPNIQSSSTMYGGVSKKIVSLNCEGKIDHLVKLHV